MKAKKIHPLEAIRTFVFNDELLGDVVEKHSKRKRQNLRLFERDLKTALRQAKKISDKDLVEYDMGWENRRFENYINSDWQHKSIKLSDVGAWPRMGSTPTKFSTGSILDTADTIKPYLEDKNLLTLETSRILYIENLMKYVEILNKHVPIIVFEDNLVRHNKFNKKKDLKSFQKTKYDIDDGNHRAVALALLGHTKINALVGKRKFPNPILYF